MIVGDEELFGRSRCRVCRRPLYSNNRTGYCRRCKTSKKRYAQDEPYRLRRNATTRRYYQKHRDAILAQHKARYKAQHTGVTV